MKTLLVACLALALSFATPALAQTAQSPQTASAASPADDTALRALIAAEQQAWNAADSAAWAATFTEDASFVNIRGDLVHTREGVMGLHRFIFAGPFKGSHLSATVESVSLLAPDVALVETVHVVTHFAFLPPGVTATEPGVLRTRMKYIITRHDGTWLVLAAQNTAVVPKAPGFQLPVN